MAAGNSTFLPIYQEGDPGNGIGGYPGSGIGLYGFNSTADRAFAFDYDHSGVTGHLVLYRPGTNIFWILRNDNGSFMPVYRQGDPSSGIAGYDIKSSIDRAFAFDYDHSGNLDHIVLYRPGTGNLWIYTYKNDYFASVYQPGAGSIGGFHLRSSADHAFAFDYDHSEKLDHLVLYRPGTGMICILRNDNGNFVPVYEQGDPGNGIGGYDLKSTADRAFAFDYDHSGKLDHIVFYRPGTGTIWILRNDNGSFAPVYAQGSPGSGIGGYDLESPADRALAFDYDHSGKLDHILLYRPGTGAVRILRNKDGEFSPVYAHGDPGDGIGEYDLKSPADRILPFDYDRSGMFDYLILYRPGTGITWILRNFPV